MSFVSQPEARASFNQRLEGDGVLHAYELPQAELCFGQAIASAGHDGAIRGVKDQPKDFAIPPTSKGGLYAT